MQLAPRISFIHRWSFASVFLFASLIGGAILLTIWSTLTSLVPSIYAWYSVDMTFRYQTEAFANGRITILPSPFNHRADWAWGRHGLEQMWGLGVPLLRFPFELLAHVIGIAHFPDRLLIFLLQVVVFASSTAAFFKLIALLFQHRSPSTFTLSLAMALATTFHPFILALLRFRFIVYEEAILVLCLWSFLQLALLICLITTRRVIIYYILCFMAGSSLLFRMTGVCYGLSSFLIGTWCLRNQRRSHLLFGTVIFAVSITFQLFTNMHRFGRLLDFGYSQQLTKVSEMDYALRFSYPFLEHSPLYGIVETLGLLFFLGRQNNYYWYEHNLTALESPFTRFREFPYPTMSYGDLTVFALGLLVAVALFLPLRHLRTIHALRPLAIWGASGFVLLLGFYALSPAIASRHLVDFVPAVTIFHLVAMLALLSLVFTKFRAIKSGALLLSVLIICSWLIGILVVVNKVPKSDSFSQELSAVSLPLTSYNSVNPDVPTQYSCGNAPQADIPANLSGWDLQHCQVKSCTTFFLQKTPCISLDVAYERGEVDNVIDVEARFMNRKAQLVSKQLQRLTGHIVFCDPEPEEQPDIVLVSIKWLAPDKLYQDLPYARLNSLTSRPSAIIKRVDNLVN